MTWYEYHLRLVPIDKTSRVVDPVTRREALERFDNTTFCAVKPSDVPVTLEHPDLLGKRREIARLRVLGPLEGWWAAFFTLSLDAKPNDIAYATDILQVGRPVSIGFRSLRNRQVEWATREHLLANLDEVAIVQPGAGCYPGAEIVSRRDVTKLMRQEQIDRHLQRIEDEARAAVAARVVEHVDPPGTVLIRPGIGRITAVY